MRDTKKRYYSELIDLLRTADIAIEVIDARFPDKTRIEKLEHRFGKKILVVAAKSDLIPRKKRSPGMIYFSSRTREGITKILDKASEIGRNNPYRKTKDIKLVVFGIPNVGKSSLINALRKKHVAPTGFRAGLTKGPQWIRLSEDMMLCDTAGVVQFDDDEESLALKSARDVTELEKAEQIAAQLIQQTALLKPNPLFVYYAIKKASDAEDVLNQIAKKRGLLGKGGEPNMHEAARMLLRDYQKGKFVL